LNLDVLDNRQEVARNKSCRANRENVWGGQFLEAQAGSAISTGDERNEVLDNLLESRCWDVQLAT
jgi:hypothetical protein